MDRRYYFERNLLALSHNPGLCSRLSGAETTLNRYRFLESRSGEIVPALVDRTGAAHPLHSMIDPRREGERLVSILKDEGFVVFLGLGGGYGPEAALNHPGVAHVLVIDYDINGIAELFCSREYIKILGDPRFSLLVDPAPETLESFILDHYRPAIAGGIRTLPLRARTEQDLPRFNAAADTIQRSIEKVSADYSVQAHFGGRWFSNIIRNLRTAEGQGKSMAPVREAAICAAGPSLDEQIPLLKKHKAEKTFIISSDTALPALLHSGLEPDAVVSIDCQHISYYHFMGCPCRNIPLFLDIASPPLLGGLSDSPFFFSGGHPLAVYISRRWRPLPLLDTSGGNVTYACLSLAENLGAERITLYGADFSYPQAKTYARGTYIFPFFGKKQNRLAPLESLFSNFLYRTPFLPHEETPTAGAASAVASAVAAAVAAAKSPCYETASLRFYRKKLEEKAASMTAEVISAPGLGVPVVITQNRSRNGRMLKIFAPGRPLMSSAEFLVQYKNAIAALPNNAADTGINAGDRQVFTTLLPQAAAFKRRYPELAPGELIAAVKNHCINEIDRVLGCS